MPPLADMGDLGIFLAGASATLGVLFLIGINVWKIWKAIKPADAKPHDTGPLPTVLLGDHPTLLQLRLYLEELSHKNRHEYKNALTVVSTAILDAMKDDHAEVMRVLDRILDDLRRR